MKSGFVCILGRPNVGKSTLLNALVGEKLAIVTHKPQTTRNRIQGIINLPEQKGEQEKEPRPAAQIILIDTPGVHRSYTSLDKKMMQEIRDALHGCDLVLVIMDASRKPAPEDKFVFDLVQKFCGVPPDRSAGISPAGPARAPEQPGVTDHPTPVFLLLNKVDLIEKARLLPMIERFSQQFPFREIIPISALKRDGLDLLLDKIVEALPQGPAYFPEEQITDQPARFLAAEIIREQVLLQTAEEVPYATTVLIEEFEEKPKLTRISATIYCEREGQKAIIIGKGGSMLKKIGTAARQEIERMLATKVFLQLFLKVRPGWREQREFVEALDWRRQLEALAHRETGKSLTTEDTE
ncbi:MAG: GTPase Era [Terriglobales bacterium]